MIPTVFFIASTGHSGSTLLDMVIGSDKNIFSMGEVRQYNKFFPNSKYLRPTPQHEAQTFQKCTCGADLDSGECSFWNKIRMKDRYFITKPRDIYFKFRFIAYIIGKIGVEKVDRDLKADYTLLLQEIYVQHGYKTFVDSSKSPQWLFFLAHLHNKGYIKLRIIRLSRHPGGVFYSHKKIGRNPYFALFGRSFTNYAASKVASKEDIPLLKIQYKDLTLNTPWVLYILGKFTGGDYNSGLFKTEYHMIGGNPMRFRGVSEIRHDDRWKLKLSRGEKLLCTLARLF